MRQAGTLSYALLDHLGTTVAMTDGAGGVTGTARYWPYGAMRASTGVLATVPLGTGKLYTGQQIESGDAALGLYNYKARFYSTTLDTFARACRGGERISRDDDRQPGSHAHNRSRRARAIRYYE